MELKDLLAVAWKRRVAVLASSVDDAVRRAVRVSRSPTEYESTATLALTPDVKQGQGLFAADNLSALLGTYAETAKSTSRCARRARARPPPARGHRRLDRGAARASCASARARPTPQTPPTAASAIATAFSDSIADNQVLDATLVDPAGPRTSRRCSRGRR